MSSPDLVRQAEVAQDPADDLRLLDERDEPEPPAAPGTGQHVEPAAFARSGPGVGRATSCTEKSFGCFTTSARINQPP